MMEYIWITIIPQIQSFTDTPIIVIWLFDKQNVAAMLNGIPKNNFEQYNVECSAKLKNKIKKRWNNGQVCFDLLSSNLSTSLLFRVFT